MGGDRVPSGARSWQALVLVSPFLLPTVSTGLPAGLFLAPRHRFWPISPRVGEMPGRAEGGVLALSPAS
ncbi:MAG TPA: hypothetical protein DIC56_05305 [Rhizobium sp.]|nr:hypothetical protein [Rhizobium sp.]